MALRAGKLRHRLALQSETQTQNSVGEVIKTYATYSTVWGSLSPLSGRELEHASQISEEITYRAVIRYLSTVATEDRISHDSRTFEIVHIANFDERNIYQELLLKEVK